MFGGNFAPAGWAFCNGQLVAIAENDALFSLLGTTYGGDGQSTFALPDLRGRRPIHWGNGPGLSPVVIGQKAGIENVTLTQNQMPAHTHTVAGGGGNISVALPCTSGIGTSDEPTGRIYAVNSDGKEHFTDAGSQSGDTAPLTLGIPQLSVLPAGTTLPHENLSPRLAVSFIIALYGIYPSRN